MSSARAATARPPSGVEAPAFGRSMGKGGSVMITLD
jgi:hypothetical protein